MSTLMENLGKFLICVIVLIEADLINICLCETSAAAFDKRISKSKWLNTGDNNTFRKNVSFSGISTLCYIIRKWVLYK